MIADPFESGELATLRREFRFKSNERSALQATIGGWGPRPSPMGWAIRTNGPLGRKSWLPSNHHAQASPFPSGLGFFGWMAVEAAFQRIPGLTPWARLEVNVGAAAGLTDSLPDHLSLLDLSNLDQSTRHPSSPGSSSMYCPLLTLVEYVFISSQSMFRD